MTTTTGVRVLPADVYDLLDFAALVNDGVGVGVGHCIHHLSVVYGDFEAFAALSAVDIGGQANDNAVQRINHRRGCAPSAHVSFADWCAELHVVRGES